MNIVVFMVNFAGGGAERAAVMLANGLADLGHTVTIAVVVNKGPYRALVQANVTVYDLAARRAGLSIFKVINCFRKLRPDAVISYMVLANTLAALAKKVLGGFIVIGVEQGSMHNGYVRDRANIGQRIAYLSCTWLYGYLNALACVDASAELAALAFTRRPDLPTIVMPNAVLNNRSTAQLMESPSHPWLDSKDVPVFISVGRLTYQKNHKLLIEAFAKVRAATPCRLIILGEGELRTELEKQIADLNLQEYVVLPGFMQNVLAWLSRSDVFVLSSRWEGLPTVLIEAAFAGLTIVSTKASIGTIELVGYGDLGFIIGDATPDALATAMSAALMRKIPKETLISSAKKYQQTQVAKEYLALIESKLPTSKDPAL